LRKAFHDLPKLASEMEKPRVTRATLDAPEPVVWSLALDEIQPTGIDQRPRLPFIGPLDFTGPEVAAPRAAAAPLSTILQPIHLDPLTVADDRKFLEEIKNQQNVPEAVRTGLAKLY
jgi:5-methylthioadenosine/S-adenosylhomocysteine deaminase